MIEGKSLNSMKWTEELFLLADLAQGSHTSLMMQVTHWAA
jgi:hypothetical protein